MTPEPGTVEAALTGQAADLIQLSLYLEAVTRGNDPAGVLRDLRLTAVTITAIRGTRGRRQVAMTFRLDADPAA